MTRRFAWSARSILGGEEGPPIPGASLIFSPELHAADFAARAGYIERFDGTAAPLTALMPAAPPDNTVIGFYPAVFPYAGALVTVDFNGKTWLGVIPTLPLPRARAPGPAPLVIFQYSAADDYWTQTTSLFELGLQLAPGSLFTARPDGVLAPYSYNPTSLGSQASNVDVDVETVSTNQAVALIGNCTLAFQNVQPGYSGHLVVIQGGAGGFTLAPGVDVIAPGGIIALSALAGSVDLLSWYCTGGTTVAVWVEALALA